MMLGKLKSNVLRAANGEVVSLPYSVEQRKVEHELVAEGLIYFTCEDDCPTYYITPQGQLTLKQLDESAVG